MIAEPIRFLIVDDVEENLFALESLLRRDGLEILKAKSGSEALELLLVHEVALAFLDVQMPDMNGFELAELMRGAERTKDVPIIFVTAGVRDPQRVFKGYESGAVDFLFKPIDPHVLKSKADVFFELYRQRRELSNSLRLNEMFVAILGHDLRNPLGAMMAGAQLLERQVTEPGQLGTLRRMNAAGERMIDMIEQLLDLTRARLAGGLGFVRVRKSLDVASLVRRAIEELHGGYPTREVRVEASEDCHTTGDADRLLQLFSNLVANALQHGTPDRPVVVSVRGEERDIVVRVRNDGAIAPEVLPTLFDPFRSREGSLTRSRGLGLGLFIARQIAVAHAGAIDVSSSPETGTAFTVHIPRRAGVLKPPPVTRRARRILVVDDDENIRESLREALDEEGYEATPAADGREALDLLRGAAPSFDAVILDLGLPIIDGRRVYGTMQADPVLKDIPVIVSTSNPAGTPPGVIFIPKPLKLDRLLRAVSELWNRSEER